MSYEHTIWKKGDKVTSTKLNKIENGIQGNDEEITSIKEDLNVFRPTATAEDVGKALIVKTVADGVPTEFEYGEAGGGSDGSTKELMDLYIDFVPNYKVEEGYYYKSGDTIRLAPPTGVVGSCKTTDIISCKEGYVYSYSGASTASLFGYALFNGDICVSVGGLGGVWGTQLTIPTDIDGVMFQSYAAPNNTPELTVDLIYPPLVTDATGRGDETEGKVWTKTANGAEWIDNQAVTIGERNADIIDAVKDSVIFGSSEVDYPYTEHTGGGYYNRNNVLTWLNFASANCRITDKIPCYEGMKFIYCGNITGGDAFKGVFFLNNDTIVSTEGTSSAYKLVTVPANVNYVVFQSTWASSAQTIPAFVVKQYEAVVYKREFRPLQGIKWTVIGDSISMPSQAEFASYCDMFVSNDGMELTNLARSGTGFSVGYGSDTKYYDRIALIPSDVQFITVTGLFNDLNRGPALGTIDDMTESTIAGCMNLFFTELLTQFPTVPMAVIMTHPWSYYHAGVEKSDNYVDMLEQMAYKYGIPFYSIYKRTNLRPWDASCNTAFFRNNGDGVHPNTYGFRQIYTLLKPFFEKMCYQTVSLYVIGKNPSNYM